MRHATKQTDYMVQVWDAGVGFTDYWPVSIYGTSRRKAVKRAPAVFCGDYKHRYNEGCLRWRVGRKLAERDISDLGITTN